MNKALAFFLAVVFAGGQLCAQTDVYVDSTAAGGGTGNGTQQNPYKSLSYAVSQFPNGGSPVSFWVAGNGSSVPYANVSGLPSTDTESFPIRLLDGMRIRYWDVDPSNAAPPAVFLEVTGNPMTCFEIKDSNTLGNNSGFSTYTNVQPLTIPDTNQGVEIREFEVGIDVADGGQQPNSAPDYFIDGVAFYECQKALKVRMTDKANAKLLVSRVLMRSASQAFMPSEPLVDVEFQHGAPGSSAFDFTLKNADIRPGDSGMLSSMIVLAGLDCNGADDDFLVTLQNVKITGQPPVNPITGPLSQQTISGAGIEFGVKQTCQGDLHLANVEVRDAQGEGLYGIAMNADAEISTMNAYLRLNGGDNPAGVVLVNRGFSGSFAMSGMHLHGVEESTWTVNAARESHFDNNRRHGVFLESRSQFDEVDGFPLAEFDLCTFYRNGLDLGENVPGHGLYAYIEEATIDLRMRRCFVTKNHSSGLNLEFGPAETMRPHELEVTTSTFSKNQGKGASYTDPNTGFFLDTNPISVVSVDDANRLTTQLSHVTVSANPTPYALALYGTTQSALESLWMNLMGSTVDNCVLNKNGYSSGLNSSDQAYYPEPPIIGTNVWTRMFAATSNSNLGRSKNGGIVTQYTITNGNFYSDPRLTGLIFMGYPLGAVFPDSGSPLIGVGTQGQAPEDSDNRGPGYARPVGGYEVGAYEIQE